MLTFGLPFEVPELTTTGTTIWKCNRIRRLLLGPGKLPVLLYLLARHNPKYRCDLLTYRESHPEGSQGPSQGTTRAKMVTPLRTQKQRSGLAGWRQNPAQDIRRPGASPEA